MNEEILLVDDDADEAELFCIAARETKIPHNIRVANSGEEAVDLLLTQHLSPVLILLDIKMPGINGLEVLRRLRADKVYRNIFIIILTGSDLEHDRLEAEKLRCNFFWTKPASLSGYFQIAERIKALLS